MALKVFRFITLMLAALATAMVFCHLMELPARMSWGQALWVDTTVKGGLYRMFGTVGAAITVGAVLATLLLAVVVRRRRRIVFLLSAAGATLFLLSLASWWAIVFPANLELATSLQGPVPADWEATRLQWETGHAVGAALDITGLGLLYASVIAETPPEPPPPR